MRALIILSIVLILDSAVSPLMAADSMSVKPAITEDESASNQEAFPNRQPMTPHQMVNILIAVADESKAAPGMVLLKFKGVELTCVYDEQHDRMRIIVPIAAQGNITSDQFEKAMNANFHTALDARYALNKGILYAAFIHPLSPLTKAQLESAFYQTATLAVTFGKEYTSGSLTYRGGGKPL
ncbi:MAG: hypothetical protein HOK41_07215 [Nitrospina sp.]|jgi:hypothetical protein|nr:hypothetical protein [Nitrospina sp.]MBT5470379.1 hypothetical protein [Nitrospina sp.]